jgi:hypothetical protein
MVGLLLRKNPVAWQNKPVFMIGAEGEETMFRSVENSPRYDSFDQLVDDLKRRYRRAHPGETDEFKLMPLAGGRSGVIKVNPSEALLIEDNRVVGHETEEQGPSSWLES